MPVPLPKNPRTESLTTLHARRRHEVIDSRAGSRYVRAEMAVLRCRACGSLNNFGGVREGKIARCGSCRGALDVSGKPQGVREEELDRTVEGSPVPVIALVWDPADPVCRDAAKRLEALAVRRVGGLVALTVDVEVHPGFRGARAIAGVPSFLLYRGQVEAGRRSGVVPEHELEEWALATLPMVH